MTAERGLPAMLDALERFYGMLPAPPPDAFALYVWMVLSLQTTPQRRDAALAALRQIPAMTPDSLARAPRGKLEAAIAHARTRREERLRALIAGAVAFRRDPELPRALRGPLGAARAALERLPHLAPADREWLLLFAGDHPMLPDDPDVLRVLARLDYPGREAAPSDPQTDDVRAEVAHALGHDLGALRRAVTYLSHHGRATCTLGDPHCGVCPLLVRCPAGNPGGETRRLER